MLQLMKIELKKSKLGWYVKGAIIANILMVVILFFASYEAQDIGDLDLRNVQILFFVVSTMVREIFTVFAGVLIAKLVVEEYKNKTILVMFSYAISRKKIIASKLLITAMLTFITVVLSNIFVAGSFFILNSYMLVIPNEITIDELILEEIKSIPFAITAAGTSLIPLYFGMRKYSVPTTVISSLIVSMVAYQNSPDFSLGNFLPFQLALAMIGIIIAYYGTKNIENKDVVL
ncbi:ABC transporter permease [Bacillus cereus group sp. TH152-1LC]|uniref:ABC transporter permease n=1 Tax=Bacillus cereus group sp. TH152-1LC TaxID=3018060 RepID=UPI0022E004D6|nr:ABC transporter permease [Bacillus cereus group sp. TH152-1LC]MDA1674679.1 ABC transporter permease [Bacillus cereus group sp. TH152-1LC]